ncbi:flagellar brake protein [Vibrio sp. CAU 1672]|uniref:flagellar brake protein n=1 Tax=Vibrio sp. CAU 1672 TaxID=3032594 RepID=UPI0023D9FF10|nr:flagellar brake protein [Vibrio sp. CAU 1672]MDF2152658.1 flagellar brake protein [Vibrio sp. CAU 1672]
MARSNENKQGAADTLTQRRQATVLNSTDAMAMVEHGSEVTLNVTTPVGTKYITTSTFVGCHSNNTALIEIPNISDEDLRFYFQEGFWLSVKAYSHRGEGAVIPFRAQLQHRLGAPYPLLILALPNTMQVFQLRKETRYEVNLDARLHLSDYRTECEIRDLSRGGCRIITSPMSRPLQPQDKVSLDVVINQRGGPMLLALKGRICNIQKSVHHARYGIEFDDFGKANAKTLLGHLKFDGTRLTLK